ncbi:MAG: VWA domain-containing protein [Pyrinomonadaceae bacterium]
MKTGFVNSLILILIAGVFSIKAQDDRAIGVIKVDTRLVIVPVIVRDRNGRYVPNLSAEDFTILQDGSSQTIEFFGATEEPLTIVLLIDTSASTEPVLDEIKEAAKSFVKLLQPRDQAMIVAFDHDIHVLSPLTSEHDRLNRAIKSAEIAEFLGTQLRDYLFRVIGQTLRPLSGRKAIILLTDGKDTTSQISIPDLIYGVQEADSLIYSVMFRTGESGIQHIILPRPGSVLPNGRRPFDPPPMLRLPLPKTIQNRKAQLFLQKLSDITGGRFYSSGDANLKKIFTSIVEELRFQYRLGFYPPDEAIDKTLFEIKVKVSRPGVVVRSRSSYRVQNRNN